MYSTPRFPSGPPAFEGKGPHHVPDSVVAQFLPFRGGNPAGVLIRSDLGLVEV